MVSYFTSYIPSFSKIALPLTESTWGYRASNLKFNNAQRQAFNNLKSCLCNSEVSMSPWCDKHILFVVMLHITQSVHVSCRRTTLNDLRHSNSPTSSVIEKEPYTRLTASLRRGVVRQPPLRSVQATSHCSSWYRLYPDLQKLTRWALCSGIIYRRCSMRPEKIISWPTGCHAYDLWRGTWPRWRLGDCLQFVSRFFHCDFALRFCIFYKLFVFVLISSLRAWILFQSIRFCRLNHFVCISRQVPFLRRQR